MQYLFKHGTNMSFIDRYFKANIILHFQTTNGCVLWQMCFKMQICNYVLKN